MHDITTHARHYSVGFKLPTIVITQNGFLLETKDTKDVHVANYIASTRHTISTTE